MCLLGCFHSLTDSPLAVFIVSQVKGTAKDALDILEINDIMGSRGSEKRGQILDQADAKLTGKTFDQALETRNSARPRHGHHTSD